MSCHVMSCHVMSCILCCCFFIMTREIKSTTELSISRHLTAVQHNVPVLGQLKSEDECLGALSLTLPLSPAYTSSFSCLHFHVPLLIIHSHYLQMKGVLCARISLQGSASESAGGRESQERHDAGSPETGRHTVLFSSPLSLMCWVRCDVMWCGVYYWYLPWSTNW